jgi:Lipocalin-like domain
MPPSVNLAGSWKLLSWRRIEQDGAKNGSVTYPLGEDATGVLIYAPDGSMAVQMTAAHRPVIRSQNALGGDLHERAQAYSTCLAYFGAWEVQGDTVIHHIDSSLYPNWSGTLQSRPFECDGSTLVLRTLPAAGKKGTVVNEMSWRRIPIKVSTQVSAQVSVQDSAQESTQDSTLAKAGD